MDSYIIASFRSRSQVLRFEDLLKKEGISAEVISTPKEVALGCGLSIKIASEDLARAKAVYYRFRPTSFVGFYSVEKQGRRMLVYGVK